MLPGRSVVGSRTSLPGDGGMIPNAESGTPGDDSIGARAASSTAAWITCVLGPRLRGSGLPRITGTSLVLGARGGGTRRLSDDVSGATGTPPGLNGGSVVDEERG